jgi:GAF domain-containing protein
MTISTANTGPLRFLKEEASRLADENGRLRAEVLVLRRSLRSLSALYYASQNIGPGIDVIRLLGEILDSALGVLKASDGSLMLVDEETGDLVFSVVRGIGRDRLRGYRLSAGQGIAGWVVAQRQPAVVRDVRHDPRFFPGVDEAIGFKTRSLVAVPVCLDDGRILGVIEVLNKVSDAEFTQEDLDLILIIAQLAATAMRRAERAIAADDSPPA